MYQFQGLGTTHMTVKDNKTGRMESLKFRIHHMTLKMLNGRVCVFYKEFMRDKNLLPGDGNGWPIFLEGANLDLAGLTTAPTLPPANLEETKKNIRVKVFVHSPFENVLVPVLP